MRGRHLLKVGFAIPDFSRRGFDDRTNRGGHLHVLRRWTTSRTARPLSFVQQRGDGQIVFLQRVFGAFVQDQIA